MTERPNPVVVDLVASAILNARGNRRGMPEISNPLAFVGGQLAEDARDDARAVLRALKKHEDDDQPPY